MFPDFNLGVVSIRDMLERSAKALESIALSLQILVAKDVGIEEITQEVKKETKKRGKKA